MSMKNTENLRKIEKNNLLKTGDFAKLANINRDTLAFYIKKGLRLIGLHTFYVTLHSEKRIF